MFKRVMALAVLVLVALVVTAPVMAQEADGGSSVNWGILAAAFAIGIAAAAGASGQAKATAAAVSALARNPGAAGDIRFALILGLALIESLVIYALLIAFFGAGVVGG
jgi:F-type H+-transporting ATPase subunit c